VGEKDIQTGTHIKWSKNAIIYLAEQYTNSF